MLQQTADVPAAHVADARVPRLVVEQGHPVLPEALVRMHPGAVVHEEWLWHERSDEPVLGADVLNDVLVHHHLVSHLHQSSVTHVDFGLTRGADLVVMNLDIDSGLDQLEDDLRAEVLQLVGRRDREIAFLVARPIGEVGF